MKDKFLPIGTVCALKNNSKKAMIVGFFPNSFDTELRQYDYAGYYYPEGNLKNNNFVSFNHSDIQSIDFMGFESNLHEELNIKLGGKKEAIVSDFSFNEDGVVTEDKTVVTPTIQNEVKSNYKFDENGVVIVDESVLSPNVVIETSLENQDYKFDENGVVVADETVVNNNPFNKEYVGENTTEINNDESIFEFDENGVVVADHSVSQKPLFEFDENGFVIRDNSVSMIQPNRTEII